VLVILILLQVPEKKPARQDGLFFRLQKSLTQLSSEVKSLKFKVFDESFIAPLNKSVKENYL